MHMYTGWLESMGKKFFTIFINFYNFDLFSFEFDLEQFHKIKAIVESIQWSFIMLDFNSFRHLYQELYQFLS